MRPIDPRVVLLAAFSVSVVALLPRSPTPLDPSVAVAVANGYRLAQKQDSLRARYRVDTLRLTRLRTRFDTVAVTVDRWATDTVRVREFVRLADSTVRQCWATVETCEQRVAVADSLRSSDSTVFAAHLKSHPGRFKRFVQRVGDAGIGALATVIALSARP